MRKVVRKPRKQAEPPQPEPWVCTDECMARVFLDAKKQARKEFIPGLDYDDIVQEMMMSALQAMNKYEPEKIGYDVDENYVHVFIRRRWMFRRAELIRNQNRKGRDFTTLESDVLTHMAEQQQGNMPPADEGIEITSDFPDRGEWPLKLQKVATLLSYGYEPGDVQTILRLSYPQYRKCIEKLRELLGDHRPNNAWEEWEELPLILETHPDTDDGWNAFAGVVLM